MLAKEVILDLARGAYCALLNRLAHLTFPDPSFAFFTTTTTSHNNEAQQQGSSKEEEDLTFVTESAVATTVDATLCPC